MRKLSRLISYQMMGLLVSYLLNCFNRWKLAINPLLSSGNIIRKFSKAKILKDYFADTFSGFFAPSKRRALCGEKKTTTKKQLCMASSYAFLSVFINDSVGFILLPLPSLSTHPFRNFGGPIQTFMGSQIFLWEGPLIPVKPLKCSRFLNNQSLILLCGH